MDKAALDEKIKEISETLFRYCMAKTGNTADAEELSQEILTALVVSVPSLRDEKAFYGFFWSLAGNVTKQWRRKQRRERLYPLPENLGDSPVDREDWEDRGDRGDKVYTENGEWTQPSGDLSFAEPLPDGLSGDDGSSMAAALPLLRRELSLLCKNYRQAVILYYLRGFSVSKIAMTLDLTESMVKYLLFRARKKLKEGMNMERRFGKQSYDPVILVPHYSGEGPNRFWNFMQSRLRQNVVAACQESPLTEEQIALEIGVPLPYIEEEIAALTDKKLLLREGRRYVSNLLIIDGRCQEESEKAMAGYREQIAEKIGEFLRTGMAEYRAIGFSGCDFSEGTLRWQLAALVFRTILGFGIPEGNRVELSLARGADMTPPVTGWGERAFLWLTEKKEKEIYYFNYSGMTGRRGDSLYFFDYLLGGKGDHRDFYGKEREINLFCDLCRGETPSDSVYDLEAIAGMVEKGYVLRDGEHFRPAVPVYSTAQYRQATERTADFVRETLSPLLSEMREKAKEILCAHTPAHLHSQADAVAALDLLDDAVGIPATLLVEKGILRTDYAPAEMPTTYAVLADEEADA